MGIIQDCDSLDELQNRAAKSSRYGNQWAAAVYRLINVIRLHDEKWKELDHKLDGINDTHLYDWYHGTLMTLGRAEQRVVEEIPDAAARRDVR